MEAHGMSIQLSKFRFKIIGIHQEALSRQLDEAINIRIIGNLNKRNEYATNELVRMESSKYSWEADKLLRDEKRSERLREEKLSCFVDVMKSVAKLSCINNQANASTNETHIYRFLTGAKRLLDNQESIPDKRCRMDSSTPLKYRDPKKIDLESSPIMGACEDVIDLSGLTLSEDSSLNNMTVEGCTVQDQTQPNEDMVINKKCHKMNITQPKKDSPTTNVAKNLTTANQHFDSNEFFRRRSISLPVGNVVRRLVQDAKLCEGDRSKSLNEFYDENSLTSTSQMVVEDVSSVSGQEVFIKEINKVVVISNVPSQEVINQEVKEDVKISNVHGQEVINKGMNEGVVISNVSGQEVINQDEEIEVVTSNSTINENDKKGIAQSVQEASGISKVSGQGGINQENNAGKENTQAFEEGEVDGHRLSTIMEELNKNKLFNIFKFGERWRRGILRRQEESIVAERTTPSKRKNREHEDGDQEICQSSPATRRKNNTVELPERRNTLGADMEKSRSRHQRIGRTRTRSLQSVDPRQPLINKVLEKKYAKESRNAVKN